MTEHVTLIFLTFVMTTISLNVEFSGGLELLFSNQRKHIVSLPSTVSGESTNLEYLIHYLRDKLLTERPELFVEKGTV